MSNRTKTNHSKELIAWGAKLILGVALLGAGLWGYHFSGQPIILQVGEARLPVRVHRLTVEAVLQQTGLNLNPADTLSLPPESGLLPGQTIKISLARPIALETGNNNDRRTVLTHRQTPAAVFAEQGLAFAPADDIYVDGRLWPANRPLPVTLPNSPSPLAGIRRQVESMRPLPVKVTLHRAISIYINDDGQMQTVQTTQQTVGDVLHSLAIPLYSGDALSADLSAPLTADMTIAISRSVPVSIQVDNRLIKTRTRSATVGQVLAQEQVALVGQDFTRPPEDAPVAGGKAIRVVRVVETLEIEKETTPFETLWVPDRTLELDIQQVSQAGQEGVTKTRTRVRYENGIEVSRQEEETWLEQEPADKTIAYGTKVVVRTLETPDGEIEYWRKIRMLATSYSAATSGKSKDHPAYGITRTGLPAGYGVVAVDPGVVPLWSQVYVPGYGAAVAGDTGGAILGKHIDLGFDEDNLKLWYRWVDVYLQTPAPRRDKIRYVLPQFPQER